MAFILYNQHDFKNINAAVNQALKNKKHPESIIKALNSCISNKPEKPYAYFVQILKIESGNYNSRDSELLSNMYKNF